MYRYDEFDRDFVKARVSEFTDQVERRLAGELTEDQFKPLRLMNGVYLQLHAYMLRVAIPYGTLNGAQMRKLADIARKYDRGYGHFTTRQNIQYNWPKLADTPDILADLAGCILHDGDADIVDHDRGAVMRRCRHGDLELARQEGEFGMKRRPLPHDLGEDARVLQLLGAGAGKLVGGDIAYAIAAGLDAMHLDLGQLVQHVGDIRELRPVQLQILPRREVAVAPVKFALDRRQFAHLARR